MGPPQPGLTGDMGLLLCGGAGSDGAGRREAEWGPHTPQLSAPSPAWLLQLPSPRAPFPSPPKSAVPGSPLLLQLGLHKPPSAPRSPPSPPFPPLIPFPCSLPFLALPDCYKGQGQKPPLLLPAPLRCRGSPSLAGPAPQPLAPACRLHLDRSPTCTFFNRKKKTQKQQKHGNDLAFIVEINKRMWGEGGG